MLFRFDVVHRKGFAQVVGASNGGAVHQRASCAQGVTDEQCVVCSHNQVFGRQVFTQRARRNFDRGQALCRTELGGNGLTANPLHGYIPAVKRAHHVADLQLFDQRCATLSRNFCTGRKTYREGCTSAHSSISDVSSRRCARFIKNDSVAVRGPSNDGRPRKRSVSSCESTTIGCIYSTGGDRVSGIKTSVRFTVGSRTNRKSDRLCARPTVICESLKMAAPPRR